jgi:tight adherence protein C
VSPTLWGAVAGAGVGLGLLLVVSRLLVIRRPQLAVRVLPYVRDVPRIGAASGPRPVATSSSAASGVFGPVLRAAAEAVERVLGGSESVRRRLERADLSATVHDFRVEQVLWGLGGFAIAAGYGVLRALGNPGANPVAALALCFVAFGLGVLARDNHLSGQVRRRERRVIQEFPTIAELLALAVAAGESPVTALERVVKRSGGELSSDLARVLAAVRTGEPVAAAFDQLAARSGLPLVARFAQGIAVAVERGTPLADVLHAQAADVREAGRRELIEVAARREVFMLVPVVFLVLPITILFAFWPGVVGLSLTTP